MKGKILEGRNMLIILHFVTFFYYILNIRIKSINEWTITKITMNVISALCLSFNSPGVNN